MTCTGVRERAEVDDKICEGLRLGQQECLERGSYQIRAVESFMRILPGENRNGGWE